MMQQQQKIEEKDIDRANFKSFVEFSIGYETSALARSFTHTHGQNMHIKIQFR